MLVDIINHAAFHLLFTCICFLCLVGSSLAERFKAFPIKKQNVFFNKRPALSWVSLALMLDKALNPPAACQHVCRQCRLP